MYLGQANYLWSQICQGLFIGCLEELAALTRCEEARVIERQRIAHDFLKSEVGEYGHQSFLEVGIADLLRSELFAGKNVNDSNQVQPDEAVHLNCERIVHLNRRWVLALGHAGEDLPSEEGRPCGKSPPYMVWLEELLNCSGTALIGLQAHNFAKI